MTLAVLRAELSVSSFCFSPVPYNANFLSENAHAGRWLAAAFELHAPVGCPDVVAAIHANLLRGAGTVGNPIEAANCRRQASVSIGMTRGAEPRAGCRVQSAPAARSVQGDARNE